MLSIIIMVELKSALGGVGTTKERLYLLHQWWFKHDYNGEAQVSFAPSWNNQNNTCIYFIIRGLSLVIMVEFKSALRRAGTTQVKFVLTSSLDDQQNMFECYALKGGKGVQ